MRDRTKNQQRILLIREFGGLERKRLCDGVMPLEFQRWLDLTGQISQNFAKLRQAGPYPLSRFAAEVGKASVRISVDQ
jgi:hypothetical protein